MRIVKVRKVGNSNVISIPREFAAYGFDTDADVGIAFSDGILVLTPLQPDRRRELVLEATRRAVKRHKRDLEILEEYDRMPEPTRARQRSSVR